MLYHLRRSFASNPTLAMALLAAAVVAVLNPLVAPLLAQLPSEIPPPPQDPTFLHQMLEIAAPVIVALLIEGVKRFIVPQMDRLSSRVQQIIVAVVSAILVTGASALGAVLPEHADVFSADTLLLIFYAALGAMGLHGVASPRKV